MDHAKHLAVTLYSPLSHTPSSKLPGNLVGSTFQVQNAVLGCNLKNDRMISVRFQGKPFNIRVIHVYAPTRYAEEAEVEWLYEDLQDLLELTPRKR